MKIFFPCRLWILGITALLSFNTSLANDQIRVTFLNPDNQGDLFWDAVTLLMGYAADDLDIDLHVIYADNDRFAGTAKAIRHLQSDQRPDYIVFPYQLHQGTRLLKVAEEQGVRSFIFNTNISESDRQRVGSPREKFKLWIGHLYPDDQSAGEALARELMRQAREQLTSETLEQVSLIAVSGSRDSTVSGDRLQGLHAALTQQERFQLKQVVHGDWSAAVAYEQSGALLRRYQSLRIIWAASDEMALAAVDAVKAQQLTPGEDLFIGGFDWTPAALEAIREGSLAASAGGHFADGAWSLVLIHDYHHGADFVNSGPTMTSELVVVTADNIEKYTDRLTSVYWQSMNFRQFSRVGREKGTYQFSLFD